MTRMRSSTMVFMLAALCLLNGCAAFRVSVKEKDPAETNPLSAKYDYNDLNSWANEMTEKILSVPFPSPSEETPILVDMGIQNRTLSHLDMQALADTITTRMLESKKVRFVNSSRRDDLLKEQGYQLKNCPENARVQIGRQLGARYMLTGSLIEIDVKSGRQVRVSKKQDVYYQLTAEVTDLETAEIMVKKQVSRLRRASKPIIGW